MRLVSGGSPKGQVSDLLAGQKYFFWISSVGLRCAKVLKDLVGLCTTSDYMRSF